MAMKSQLAKSVDIWISSRPPWQSWLLFSLVSTFLTWMTFFSIQSTILPALCEFAFSKKQAYWSAPSLMALAARGGSNARTNPNTKEVIAVAPFQVSSREEAAKLEMAEFEIGAKSSSNNAVSVEERSARAVKFARMSKQERELMFAYVPRGESVVSCEDVMATSTIARFVITIDPECALRFATRYYDLMDSVNENGVFVNGGSGSGSSSRVSGKSMFAWNLDYGGEGNSDRGGSGVETTMSSGDASRIQVYLFFENFWSDSLRNSAILDRYHEVSRVLPFPLMPDGKPLPSSTRGLVVLQLGGSTSSMRQLGSTTQGEFGVFAFKQNMKLRSSLTRLSIDSVAVGCILVLGMAIHQLFVVLLGRDGREVLVGPTSVSLLP